MRTPPVFRPLGLALMAIAATGVLLQIGYSEAPLVREGEPVDDGDDAKVLAAYAKLPLAFVPNAGQLDRRVRYAAQAGRLELLFHAKRPCSRSGRASGESRFGSGFLGANPAPAIAGARPGHGHGQLPDRQRPGPLAHEPADLRRVVYRDLWPGIDLRLRGQSGKLKYEFRLAPGADPSRIRLGYRGQQRLSLGQGGELRIETALGLLRDARPVSYQQIGGRRVAVKSRFVLGRGGAYGFTVGALRPPLPARDRPRPSLLHLPGRKRHRRRRRHRGRRRRQRLPDRVHGLGGLPDDRGRLRHDLQRRLATPS